MQSKVASSKVPSLNNRIWSTAIGEHIGQRIRVSGWLHRLRRLSNVTFLILRDRKGLAQIVIEDPQVIAQLDGVYHESVLHIEGKVVLNPQAPNGVEIHEPRLELVSCAEPQPFDLFRPSLNAQLPTLLDNAPIYWRHLRQRAVWQIAAATMSGFRGTLRALDFTEIQTPKIVASATEGGANVFAIDYLGKSAYLAQSPQFYKQMMVGVFERVFEIGPVFRAEPHSTPRHLNEYVSMDVELGFIQNHHTVMQVLHHVLSGLLDALHIQAQEALELLDVHLPAVPAEIPVIHFVDALEMIFKETGEDARHEPDLAPSHERWLGEWAKREFHSDFLFVEGYPMIKRPFYTHPDPTRPAYSNSFDLLFRGVEMVTGGQRLHLYADYRAVLAKRGLSETAFAGYLEAFKYGMPPHGGFAIGLERWVMRLLEVANVREVKLFPRDLERLTP